MIRNKYRTRNEIKPVKKNTCQNHLTLTCFREQNLPLESFKVAYIIIYYPIVCK